LRIGTLHTFGPYILPSILQDMEQSAGPLQLDLHEGDQRRLTELLRAGDIDLAFLYDFGIADDLQATPLATLSPYVLLPDGHPLAAHERIALADLLDERLVLLDAPPSRDYFLSCSRTWENRVSPTGRKASRWCVAWSRTDWVIRCWRPGQPRR
jgi:DNA-binding transcriptional LysR family regulator